MQVKRHKIKDQDFDKVAHLDASAVHWSQEHSKHQVAANAALNAYQDMTAAKNQVVTDMCKAAGFDMTRVVQARLGREDGDSFVEVIMHPEPASPPPGEPETAPPAAPPAAPSS